MNFLHLRSAAGTPSCSGRTSAKSVRVHEPRSMLSRLPLGSRQHAIVFALYNFTDAAEVRVPGQRRNRGALKREARELLDIVRGLTSMTSKQLSAVGHLLPPGTVDAVGIAARLPRSNQGRKRQEGLVAKLLRSQLSEQQLDKLGDAVLQAAERSGVYEDTDVGALVAAWREGLLGEEQSVISEVYGYPATWAPDHQQLRTLVRQCQQALAEEAQVAEQQQQPLQATRLGSSASGEAFDVGDSTCQEDNDDEAESDEEEDLAAILAEASARSVGGAAKGRKGGSGGAAPRSRALLRSLTRMLRQLATRVVQEELGEQ